MAEKGSAPTISLRERTFPIIGAEDRLPKWLTLSLLGHGALIVGMFLVPMLPSTTPPAPPVYTVDLIGGEKIGRSNLGTELAPADRPIAETKEESFKPEIKKEKVEKNEHDSSYISCIPFRFLINRYKTAFCTRSSTAEKNL